ncbi:MAG: Signal transduction histidine kinase, nitrogen specific, NtrB [Desulfotomaculum sp. 46_296]|nr:MAG: Signal transduction histidine kinase, nitrogen specific, NtrB [Desulfotomaculum sp. 46_296]HAU32550.1 PAS domain-containing sensor histidine kinase [Desulfotomaculum sp.]
MGFDEEKTKELREYISATHMFSLLILICFFILNRNFIPKEIYPASNIRYFILITLLILGAVLLYVKNASLPLRNKSFSWIDLVYVTFPLIMSIFTLFAGGNNVSYGWIIFFLPILVTASVLGKIAGIVMAFICAVILMVHQILFPFINHSLHVNRLEPVLIIISVMFVVGWFIGGLSDLEAQQQKRLKYRLQLEEIIANISTKFISLTSEEISLGINNALKTMGDFSGADRVYIICLPESGSNEYTFYSWLAEGCENKALNQNLSKEKHTWWWGKLSNFESIHVSDVRDLPSEANAEKEFFLFLGVQSVIAAPLIYGNKLVGFIGAETKKPGKKWTGEIVMLLKVAGDILVSAIERNKSEEALRLSEECFSKVFRANPVSMSLIALADEKIIDTNEVFIENCGYSREEVIGHSFLDINLINSIDYSRIIERIKEHGHIYNYELEYCKKSGETGTGLYSGVLINLRGQPCLLTLVNDITVLRKFEKEMLRLESLNLIGQMAGGIAHEIRNPMTTVRGYLQYLGDKKECMSFKDVFDLMIDELDRANSIVTDYLSLSKHKAIELKIQNLNDIIKAAYPLIQADVKKAGVKLVVETEKIPDLPLDEKEIRQLIFNLVRNSIEAMTNGGVLTIRTYLDDKDIVMAVQDQGAGIDSELIEKIGTPFFTTKENGTGLGLAVCYSIADRHNAVIKVKSGSNGTTFLTKFGRGLI